MAGEVASTVVQLHWEPEGPVAYELMSTTNDVRFDASGSPSRGEVSVSAFRLSGDSRTVLPVNLQTGAQHIVALVLGTGSAVGRSVNDVVQTGALRSVGWARFDLVHKSKVSMSGTTPVYADADVLASIPVAITHDGSNGTNGSFVSTVFVRCPSKPDAPTGGKYTSPYPTSTVKVGTETRQWTDAPPTGTDPIWISRAVFNTTHTSDSNAPAWSTPVMAVDSNDVEFIWSKSETRPNPPTSHPFDRQGDVWSKNATDAVWMAVAIKREGVWGDWEVSRVKGETGAKGESAIVLDLDNEVQGVACAADGTPASGSLPVTAQATVYVGTQADTGWTFSRSVSGCTALVSPTGKVSVTAMTADRASVTVTATSPDGKVSRSAVMSLYKVKAGADGSPATVYSILSMDSAIVRGQDGTLTPPAIAVWKMKTVGSVTEKTSEKKLKYLFAGIPLPERELAAAGGAIHLAEPNGYTLTGVELRLYDDDGTTVLDSETVPVISDGVDGIDGIDGIDGENAVQYSLVLDPTSVKYDLNASEYDTGTVDVRVVKTTGKSSAQLPPSAWAAEKITLFQQNVSDTGAEAETACNGQISFAGSTWRWRRIDFILRHNGVEVDRRSLDIIADGQNGTNGKNGVWVPPPMEWDDYPTAPTAYQFQAGDVSNGDVRLDMVLTRNSDGKLFLWQCIQTHVKGASGTLAPGVQPNSNGDNGYWRKADSGVWKFVATELLWANIGQINFFNSQAIRVGDSSGMCGYFGVPTGGAVFYSGGAEAGNATFVVYKDGKVVARYAEIEGSISASTLDLKVSTVDSGVPNGSLCYDVSAIKLPELSVGRVRVLKVLNPYMTRLDAENLYLTPATNKVCIYEGLRFDHGNSAPLTLSGCGRNGGVYIELMGFYNENSKFTQWGVVRRDSIN